MPVLGYIRRMDGKAAPAQAKTKRKRRPLVDRLEDKRLKYEHTLRQRFNALMEESGAKPDDPSIEKRARMLLTLRKAFLELYPAPKARGEAEMDDRRDGDAGGDRGEDAAMDAWRSLFEHKVSRYHASRSAPAVAEPARRGDDRAHADGVEHLGPG